MLILKANNIQWNLALNAVYFIVIEKTVFIIGMVPTIRSLYCVFKAIFLLIRST